MNKESASAQELRSGIRRVFDGFSDADILAEMTKERDAYKAKCEDVQLLKKLAEIQKDTPRVETPYKIHTRVWFDAWKECIRNGRTSPEATCNANNVLDAYIANEKTGRFA
jgi:hypothetical protein